MGVLLDSSVIIAAERSRESPLHLLIRLHRLLNDQEIAISSIGYTELLHGLYRATSDTRRARRRAFIDTLKAGLPIYPYTEETAEIAGKIDAEQQALGLTIPYVDLLIGATALSLNFSILTANLRHFRMIPNLSVIPF